MPHYNMNKKIFRDVKMKTHVFYNMKILFKLYRNHIQDYLISLTD